MEFLFAARDLQFLVSQQDVAAIVPVMNDYYYLIYGIGPQRINTEGIACSKMFFLYPKGNLIKKWDNSKEMGQLDRKITGFTCGQC